MATSIFADKAILPTDEMVNEVLKNNQALWDQLQAHLLQNYSDIEKQWKYYSNKAGWTLVVKKKKRTLFYFLPCLAYFKILFVFGEKAVAVAQHSTLPQPLIDDILAATAHMEGRSFFVDVKQEEDLSSVKTLLKVKDES